MIFDTLRKTEDENRVQAIVSQHQKEIKVLQTQFQQMLDLKDKELEGFSYRLKTVTTSQQKDLERLSDDYRQKFSSLDLECQKKEESLKSKALEMRWMAAEFESSEVSFFQIKFVSFFFFRFRAFICVGYCLVTFMVFYRLN